MAINRTIKTDYDGAPLAGADPTKVVYLQADDGSSDIGMSISQLAAAVQYNLGLVAEGFVLRITIAPNTLIWQADPISGIEYTHHMYTEDEDSVPSVDDARWLYESQRLQGTLSSWSSKTIRLFVREGVTVTQVPTADGTDAATVTPTDTLSPNPVTDLAISDGTLPATQFKYLFTAVTDAGSGIAGYRLRNDSNAIVLTSLTAGVLIEVTAGSPGEILSLWVEAYDNAGNATNPSIDATNVFIHTMGTTATAGIISLSAETYDEDDDNSPLNAVLNRPSASGTSGPIQVTVSTRHRFNGDGDPIVIGGVAYEFDSTSKVSSANDTIDLTTDAPGWSNGQAVTYSKTADDSTNTQAIGLTEADTYYVRATGTDIYELYTDQGDAINGTGTQVDLTSDGAETHILFEGEGVGYEQLDSVVYSWVDGNSDPTNVPIRVVQRVASVNTAFQVEIDHGSASAGSIGALNAAICTIDSSATGLTGWQQETSTANKVLCVEAESYNDNQGPIDDRAANLWNAITDSRCSGSSKMQPTIPGILYGTATELDPDATYLQWDCAFNATGSYDFQVRTLRGGDTSGENVHLAVCRPIKSITKEGGHGGTLFDLVTLWDDHGLQSATNGGKKFHIEGTTNFDGSYDVTLATTATDSFDIPTQGPATEDYSSARSTSIIAFGDATLVGYKTPPYYTNYTATVAHWASEADQHFVWGHYDATGESGGERYAEIAAVGTYPVRLYRYRYGPHIDKIAVTYNAANNSAYSASNVYDLTAVGTPQTDPAEYFGPIESSYSTTPSPTDSAWIPTSAWIPLPSATITAPTLSPANDVTSEVPLTELIYATYAANVTGIIMQTMTVSAGGNRIQGAFRVLDRVVSFDRLLSTLSNNTLYEVVGTGTGYEDGVLRSIDFGTWQFKTLDSAASGVIYHTDLLGTGLVSVPVKLDQPAENVVLASTGNLADAVEGGHYLAPDPIGGGMGNTLRIDFLDNQTGHGNQVYGLPDYSETRVYCGFNMLFPAGWDMLDGIKVSHMFRNNKYGIASTTNPDGSINTGYCSFSIIILGSNKCPFSKPTFFVYWHHANRPNSWGHEQSMCTVDPTRQATSDAEAVQIAHGQWMEFKAKAKMNTIGASDGIAQLWLNGALVFERTNVKWTTEVGTDKWEYSSLFSCFVGGDSTWKTPQAQSHYYGYGTVADFPL